MWGNGTEIDVENGTEIHVGKSNRERCGKMEQRYMRGNGPEIHVGKWNRDICGKWNRDSCLETDQIYRCGEMEER